MKITRTTTKRLLSILLCICMMLSTAPLSAMAQEYPTITPGVPVTVSLDATTTEAIYAFTPTEDGVYSFYSFDNEHDTFGYLLDADGNELVHDDDSGGVQNFLITQSMTAGTTYLLKARFYNTANSGSMTITVEKAQTATAITIIPSETYTDRVAGGKWFAYELTPAQAVTGGITWSSSDPSVVLMRDDGYAFMCGVGTATITVATAEGVSASCEVTVADVVGDLTLGTTYTATFDGTYMTASYRFIPEEDGWYAFSSSVCQNFSPYAQLYSYEAGEMYLRAFDNVLNDDSFYVQYELTAGTTYYFVATMNSSSVSYDVTLNKIEPATELTLDHTTLELHTGLSAILRPVYTPTNAIHETLTWTSSDPTVVTVDQKGKVSAVEKGTATVTVTSASGMTASCEVTVGDYPTLSLCKPETIDISVGGNVMCFYFTPEKDGIYAFYASVGGDTYGHIYDATGETELAFDDDGGEGNDFRVEYAMTAGTTYVLKARYFNNTITGSFDVRVVLTDGNGNTVHNIPSYDFTEIEHCGICDDCGEAITAPHVYDETNTCMCGYQHTHTVTEWEYDTQSHWGDCVCGEYFEESHTFDENGDCVCGYFEHEHTTDSWSYDEEWHEGDCTECGFYFETTHVYDENGNCICGYFEHKHTTDAWNSEIGYHYANCVLCGFYCEEDHTFDENGDCICGYFEHTHEVTFEYDVNEHWGNCTVCELYVNEYHTFDENGDCICGYFEHEHDANIYKYDRDAHWLACSQCGLAQGGSDVHTYDENGVCTVCSREPLNGVSFGSILLQNGEYLDNNGNITTEAPAEGGYAYYKDGVLILHDFVYATAEENLYETFCVVYAERDLTLVLEGQSNIRALNGDGMYIYEADLTVSGDGTLAIKAGGDFDGIDVDGGNLMIEGGTLLVEGGDHGIEVNGDLEVRDGMIVIVAGDDGFDVTGSAVFNSGVIDIVAEDNGIDVGDALKINGGSFTISTNDDNGIEATGALTVNGGAFEIDANDECFHCVDGTLTVNGGEFVLEAGLGDAVMMAYEDIVFGEAMGELPTAVDEYGYTVLTDENGNVLQIFTKQSTDTVMLQSGWITLSQTKGGYTGEIHTPTVMVTDGEGNTLVEGTDYTLAWSAEPITEIGTYTVTVTGIGAYSGVKFKTYSVYEDIVYVGGVKMANGDYLDLNGNITAEAPAEGGYAYYKDGVLTLNDYAYEGAGYVYNEEYEYSAGIYSLNELTIEPVGNNTLITVEDGITVYADLTIGGEGSLAIESAYGIYNYDGDVTINSATLRFTALDDAIWAYGDVNITGGELTVAAGNCGIYARYAVNVSGGALTLLDAEADGDDNYYGYGIYADYGDITISGGTVVIDTKCGIYAYDYSVNISGGTVDITGEYGIWADYYDVIISGGIVTIEADCGIYACYGVYVDGGLISVTSTEYAVCADAAIILYDNVTMTLPENGRVETVDCYYIVDEAGGIATDVILDALTAGDVNADGVLDTSDARITLHAIVGLTELTEKQQQLADVNGDGMLNSTDVRGMLLAIANAA